jgi:RNA-directed DNA polymerase
VGAGQRKKQLALSFPPESKGEARGEGGRVEASPATHQTSGPTTRVAHMEAICSRENMIRAYKRVHQNHGGPGVDRMRVEEALKHLQGMWPTLKEELLTGRYEPEPVRSVEIPKPSGGKRKLGIPTVIDRIIQQAILQVLQPIGEKEFSRYSYGFRPGRNAQQAVAQAQRYVAEGYTWVVDLDLEKFFDRVNHDRLMASLAKRIDDKALLKVIRGYLTAGALEGGLVKPRSEGTPQGGPLSPFLSNIVLHELDQELERRGHRFVRYADDCNIYVRSRRAGERVMERVTVFIERKLKLRVNREKSAVDRPPKRKFLGFRIIQLREPKRGIAPQSIERFKTAVRSMTRPSRGWSIATVIERLNKYLTGWRGYFGFCETPKVLKDLDSWVRRRIRCSAWRQWKTGRKRYQELTKRGVNRDVIFSALCSSMGPWRASHHPAMQTAYSNQYFREIGLVCAAAT